MKTDTLFEKFFAEKPEFHSMDFTLDRIQSAADMADVADNIAKYTIHIAGTNGKGSTAYFIEQILLHRGLTTAVFTSPHVTSITERIRLNGKDITSSEFDGYFTRFKHLIEEHNLTYFEGLTLIAFRYFKDNSPDVAIIETGLGGRLDSTNILNTKIPVITSISKDHTGYLGEDILGIADEKLAIVKNNLLIFAGDNSEYMNRYIDYKLHSKTICRGNYSEEPYMGFESPFANNLRLAEAVCDYLSSGSLPPDLKLPPCRNERFGQFILDGAHNKDALKKLAERYKGKTHAVVFTSTCDRDINEMLQIVETFASKIIITELKGSARSIDLDTINTDHIKEKDPYEALKIAVELSGNADILVCGSLYLCAHVREILSKGLL